MDSIQPIRPQPISPADSGTLPAVARSQKIADVPENVFAPPGVFTRLTAILNTYHTPDRVQSQPRAEEVAKGKDLAADPNYPQKHHLSAVVNEILGYGK